MPRWLFLACLAAVALAVIGSALVALRGAPAPAPGPAACLSCPSPVGTAIRCRFAIA